MTETGARQPRGLRWWGMGTEAQDTAAAEVTLLVLGAAGDVTTRWLLPGLGRLVAAGGVRGLRLVGADRADWDDQRWRRRVADAFASAGAAGALIDQVVDGARYLRADVTDEDDLRRLLATSAGRPILYFALPSAVAMRSCQALVRVGVPEGAELVLEKPFGADAASARALNEVLAVLAPERRIHRVDHFLGMSTVLNLLGLRFANRIVEPVLTAEHVAAVDVVFDETLALEGRAGYYDHAGALVDMIQNHLLQILAFIAMPAPATLSAPDVRARKLELLREVRVWRDDPVRFSRRARYTAGEVDGRRLPAYVDEAGVDPGRRTETFAEVVLEVTGERWAGVPFRLRTGKALGASREEVVVTFKGPPALPAGLTGEARPDRLRIGIGPRRLALDLTINGPRHPFELDPVSLEATFPPGDLPPYGEVLRGILRGDPPLSVSAEAAVRCWEIVEPVRRAWREDLVPLAEYPAGSAGPAGELPVRA